MFQKHGEYSLKALDSTELQILGALYKMKGGDFQEDEKGLVEIARKTKANLKSLKWNVKYKRNDAPSLWHQQ